MARTVLLRVFGVVVAAFLGLAATAVLWFALGGPPDGPAAWLQSIAVDLQRPANPGAFTLIGVGLAAFALGAGFLMARTTRPTDRVMAKSGTGVTTIDMVGLAAVTQRKLRRQVDPSITVRPMRRKGLSAVVPTHSGRDVLSAVNEVAIALPALLGELGADVRYQVVSGQHSKRRVR